METTKPQHYQEWLHSAVNPEIIKLNIVSCRGSRPYDYLLISDDIPRRNDGRIRDHILKRYRHIEHGGWWCNGINLLTGELDLWGCFKPDRPRRNPDKPQKRIKYEHPPKTATGVFALQIPLALGQQIARKYGFEPNFISQNKYNWFWQWVINNPEIPIIITEGAKKAGALLSAGYVAIALPGINSGYRVSVDQWGQNQRELIPELEILATAGRTFYLSFDQDQKPSTVESVAKAQERLGRLLVKKGADVNVVTWDSGDCKGCDDLIFLHGAAAYEQAYQRALPLPVWVARQYRQLNYPADISLEQRFLGELSLPEVERLIGIKSPKGTGKTEFLVPQVAASVQEGQRVIVITHRIQLSLALCQRFGINYITEVRTSEEGELFGYGLCIDSLHPQSQASFKAEDWEGCLVILDEAEQVIWHMLNSSTCQAERVPILKSFKSLIQGAQRVIAADADLSDLSIDYLKSLMGVKPYIINNTYKFDGWNVYRYPKPETLVENLKEEISNGGKPFICLSAQKVKSLWGTQGLENYLLEQFPELKILRIDSESIADPNHQAFGSITKLNELLPHYDTVITSPSIETGVSIDIKEHFTSVWGIAQGVQPENSVRQSLARLREPVDRHLYAAPHGLGKIGNGSTSYKSLMASENAALKANLKLLERADLLELKLISDPDELVNFQPETLRCWAKMAMRHNAGLIKYDQQIFAELEAEGHKIISVESDSDSSKIIRESLKASRDKRYLAERKAITDAQPFESEAQYLACKDKQSKTKEERHQERHWEMRSRYGEVTPDLLELDDLGCYQKLRLHYYLTLGRSHLQDRDKENAKPQILQGLFAPDFNRSQKGLKVGALEILGIKELLNPNREFKNSDADLIELHRKVTIPKNRWQLKAIGFGNLKETDTPMQTFKKLLNSLGISLTRVGRETHRGSRHWIYKLNDWGERRGLFALWFQRDEDKRQLALAPFSKNVSTSGKYKKEISNLDTLTKDKQRAAAVVVKQLETAAPSALKGLVERCVRSEWWAEVRDIVWTSVTVFVRQVIDELDFEERYGF